MSLAGIGTETGDVSSAGEFGEKGGEVGHEVQFRLGAGFPAEVEGSHEVAELFAVEDHAVEDGIHEGLEGIRGEAVAGDRNKHGGRPMGARRFLWGLLRRCGVSLLVPLAAVALTSVLGYLYGVGELYGVARYIPMALPTALGFLALSTGILCARPDRGLMQVVTSDEAGGVLARRLLPAAILIPAGLGWLRHQDRY